MTGSSASAQVPTPLRAAYAEVVRVPGAKGLLVTGVLARLPVGMLPLALLLLVHGRTGSLSLAGLAVGMFALTGAASSPVLGTAVDRLGQTGILLATATTQTVCLCVLVGAASIRASGAVLVLISGLAGLLVPPIAACARTLWPDLLATQSSREAAYMLDAISQELIWIAGPLVVSGFVAAATPSATILVAAAITLCGAFAFARLPASRAFEGRRIGPRFGRVLSSPDIRLLLVTIGLFGALIGTIEVGLPALALTWGSRTDGGIMLALASVGSALGGIAYGMRAWKRGLAFRYPVTVLGGALALLPLTLVDSRAAGLTLSVLAGVPIAPIFSCQSSLTALLAPATASTEAFMWNLSALICGLAIGSAVGGALAQSSGVAVCFVFGAGACALASALLVIHDAMRPRSGADTEG